MAVPVWLTIPDSFRIENDHCNFFTPDKLKYLIEKVTAFFFN